MSFNETLICGIYVMYYVLGYAMDVDLCVGSVIVTSSHM